MNQIILQGFPYDEKSSFLKGSSQAPPLIREFMRSDSTNTFAENRIDINHIPLIDKGDFSIRDYFEIEAITLKHLNADTRILSLGGDHSITYPIIKAINKQYGQVSILHIDAHADLYDTLDGDKYSHACPFARIMEARLANQLVQLGIRTLTDHQRAQAERFGVEVYEMNAFDHNFIPDLKHPVYVSIDLDGIDPAFAPGVSHHEPGGLTTREVLNILHRIKNPVIGADVVEYNPKRDVQGITGALAAKLTKELLAMMGAGT